MFVTPLARVSGQSADTAVAEVTLSPVPLVRIDKGGWKWGTGMRLLGRRRCGQYFAALDNAEHKGGVLMALSDTAGADSAVTSVYLLPLRKINLIAIESLTVATAEVVLDRGGRTKGLRVSVPAQDHAQTLACLEKKKE